MARTKLTSGGKTTDGTSFTTASATAPANTLVLLFVSSSKAGLLAGAPSSPSVKFAGTAMSKVKLVTIGDRGLSCFQLKTTQATSGTFQIDFNTEQQDYCAWSAFCYDGVDAVSPVAGSNVATTAFAGSTLSLDLDGADGNACAAAIIIDKVADVTPGNGLGEVHEIGSDQGLIFQNATLETADAQPLVHNVSWTWPGSANAAALVVEVKIAAPQGGTGTGTGTGTTATPHKYDKLIRRFEPILFLHENEKFYPVNAQRFVESANLWSTAAGSPSGKASWGSGPSTGGATFPRTPTAMKVSTVAGELGTFYLGSLDAEASAGSFLELGGWNNAMLVHESGVDDTTDNVYSDRDGIDVLYGAGLKDSRFWYHAEVYDLTRLNAVAATISAPDPKPPLTGITRPVLLCYYLFFPAHVQSVECKEGSGTEVSSHAGDWQCIAILLDGDPEGNADLLDPRYFGITGSKPAADIPNAFDDEKLTVMKVFAWTKPGPGASPLPQTTAKDSRLHPHVYVALGSHSLYAAFGDNPVDPYPTDRRPHDCGRSDSTALIPPPPNKSTFGQPDGSTAASFLGLAAFLLKLLTGASAGAAIGSAAGSAVAGSTAAGWTAGMSGFLEFLNSTQPPFGGDTETGDTPSTDIGPEANKGTTIQPFDVDLPDAGTTIASWQVGQGATIGGQARYDYIVERAHQEQIWWPSDNGELGYLGRWGQAVTNDTLPRRAGPRFPNYAKMFLLALADLASRP
jgi:hypothetical protein